MEHLSNSPCHCSKVVFFRQYDDSVASCTTVTLGLWSARTATPAWEIRDGPAFNWVLVVARPDQVDELSQRIPLLAGRTQIDGAATAYVCEN
jgi:hypothetical protein